MSISEAIPIVTSLSDAEKFKLIQIIFSQIAKWEEIPSQVEIANQQDPLWDIIGIAEGKECDVARRHDDYLYGAI